VDYPLTEEQKMLVESLRVFREQELEPYEAEVDRTGEVPEALSRYIRERAIEMGFYAPNLPESIGGGGLDYKCLALFERELGKSSFGLHGNMHRPSEILMACKGDQIEEYLKPCVTGEKKEVFALTEPGAGSDIMSMQPVRYGLERYSSLMEKNILSVALSNLILPFYLLRRV